jgi:uncharacterized protein (TIGR02594 family)
MKRYISAKYHANLKVAEFIADDGSRLLRSGGTLPWRINNCGSLSSPVDGRGVPSPKHTQDYVGFANIHNKNGIDTYNFFIFPNYDSGRRQLKATLKRKYSAKTIPEVIAKYAPPRDNDTNAYVRNLLKDTGVEGGKKIENFTDSELEELIDAIQKIEGFHNSAETRVEKEIYVSTIVATDGSKPLLDEEIILRVNGKESLIKSNAVGQFPPIIHQNKDDIEILQKKVDEGLAVIGKLVAGESEHFSLVRKFGSWLSRSEPEKPSDNVKSNYHPFVYTVAPGDSLGKIGNRFQIDVERIKRDNNLKSDRVFPGQRLSIFGSAVSEALQKAAPKKSLPMQVAATKNSDKTKVSSENISAFKTKPARSKEGEGKKLAIISLESGRTPWMAYAIAEAKRWKGRKEDEIEKEQNYHALIKNGRKSLSGSLNAWCSAFVNWCLLQAGYPIDNKEWSARARGIYSNDVFDEKKRLIQNPLFIELGSPIYGAIALVTNIKSDMGSHVAFVYGHDAAGHMCLLGGNQSDRIMFTPFALKGVTNRLRFFIPSAYAKQAQNDIEKNDLQRFDSKKINIEFNIIEDSGKAGSTR